MVCSASKHICRTLIAASTLKMINVELNNYFQLYCVNINMVRNEDYVFHLH